MTSFRSRLKCFLTTACAGLALGAALAGCGDMLTHAQDANREGLRLYNQGDYVNAAGAFQEAARQDPRDYRTQYYLGQCYEQMKTYPSAIAAYKQCLALQPYTLAGKSDTAVHETAFDRLAHVVATSDPGNVELDALEKGAKDSAKPDDYRLIGRVYAYRGDADSALDSYNRAYRVAPHDFAINKEYGLYLEKVGQTQKAAIHLKEAYKANQQDQQVADGLRQIGIPPGPALLDENQLARPLITTPVLPARDAAAPTQSVNTPQD